MGQSYLFPNESLDRLTARNTLIYVDDPEELTAPNGVAQIHLRLPNATDLLGFCMVVGALVAEIGYREVRR